MAPNVHGAKLVSDVVVSGSGSQPGIVHAEVASLASPSNTDGVIVEGNRVVVSADLTAAST
jgi:hypothetical protein